MFFLLCSCLVLTRVDSGLRTIPTAIITKRSTEMGQEWLNASTGMPGVLELELGRPVLKKEKKGKKKKKKRNSKADFVSKKNKTQKCKRVLLTIQLTSSFLYCISLSCVSPLALVQSSLSGLWWWTTNKRYCFGIYMLSMEYVCESVPRVARMIVTLDWFFFFFSNTTGQMCMITSGWFHPSWEETSVAILLFKTSFPA